MDKLKATLGRKVGPFSVGAWLIIVVAGVGIGLLLRKRLGSSGGDDESGQAGVGFSDRDDFPLGIRGGVVVTGTAPTTVTIPGEGGEVEQEVAEDGKVTTKKKKKKTGTDVVVPPPVAPPPPAKPPTKTVQPKAKTYKVVKGDSLRKISAKFYGNPDLWPKIYQANRSTIGGNPDLIKPGQMLVIPPK